MPPLPQEQDLQKTPQGLFGPPQEAPQDSSAQPPQQLPQIAPQASQQPQRANWETALPGIAQRYGVQEDLIRRVIKQESGGNPSALSPKGAMGLMQLMPATAQRYGINPHDPVANLDAGTRELVRLLEKYQHYGKALAAYNAGEGVVDRLSGAGGFDRLPEETRNYVSSIMQGYQPPQQIPKTSEIERRGAGQQPFSEPVERGLLQAQKYAVEPFEKMAQGGAELGRQLAMTPFSQGGQTHDLSEEERAQQTLQAQQAHPIATGIASGLGQLAGSTLGDPRNWPFFGAAAARPILQRLISGGFGVQMGEGAYQQAKNLYQNWDAMNPNQRSEAITQLIAGLGMTGMAAHGAIKGPARAGRVEPQLTPREQLAETPSTIQRPAPSTQVTAQAAPSVAQEGAERPATVAGISGAREVTGGSPATVVSAPIEQTGGAVTGRASMQHGQPQAPPQPQEEMQPYAPPVSLQQKIGQARAAGLLPEQRQQPGVSPTGQERRTQAERDYQTAMATTPPGQPTPGEQLSQQIRQARAGAPSDVSEGQAMMQIMRNPTLYEQFRNADKKTQQQMLIEASRSPKGAQRPTGLAQTPAPTPTAAPIQPVPGPRPAEAPIGAPREPVRPQPEPVRTGPAQQPITPAAQPPAPKKPYVPLPAEERPFVRVRPKGAPEPPVREPAPPVLPPTAPAERKVSEVQPGVPATPRPEKASAEQLAKWQETRRAEAAARDVSMKQEAPYKPKVEGRSPVGAALDRYLKPPGDYKGDRGAELVREVEEAKKAPPEARQKLAEEMSNRAQRAEQMVAWAEAQMGRDVGAEREVTRELGAGHPTAALDPITGEPLRDPETGKLKGKGFELELQDPARREALNRLRGNVLKEVGERTPLDPEVEKQVRAWEAERDRIVQEQRGRNARQITQHTAKRLEQLINGIQAARGTRWLAEKGPQAEIGPTGGLTELSGANREAWNRFMERSGPGHTRRPSDEDIAARIKYLNKEASYARSIAKQLGAEAPAGAPEEAPKPAIAEAKPVPAVKEAPPPRATAPVEPAAERPVEVSKAPPTIPESETGSHAVDLMKFITGLPAVRENIPTKLVTALQAVHEGIPDSDAKESLAGRIIDNIRKGDITPQQAAARYGKGLQELGRGTKALPGPVAAPKEAPKAPAALHSEARRGTEKPPRPAEAPRPAPTEPVRPARTTPVSKSSLTREGLEDLGRSISRMPKGEEQESLSKRLNNISERFENITERMKWTARHIEQMRKAGETQRTFKDPKTGKERSEKLADLEFRLMKLGQERAPLINEEIPSLKAAVQALGKPAVSGAPTEAPTITKPTTMPVYGKQEPIYEKGRFKGFEAPKIGEKEVVPSPAPKEEGAQARIDELQSQRQHLANLINRGWGDSRKAADLKKTIGRIERDLGFKAPAPIPGVKETLEGAGLLKAAKRAEPKPPAEKAVYAPEILKNLPAEDLYEILKRGDLSTPLIDRAMAPNKAGKRSLGKEEGESLARPILKELQENLESLSREDPTAAEASPEAQVAIGEAGKRFNRALEVLLQGRQAASKIEDVAKRHDAMQKAFSNAIEIAKGRRLRLPEIKEGGFVGRPGGRGMEAAKRIREEREREEKGPFYNKSERVVREEWPGSPESRQNPKDVAGMLVNAGVSKNELKWSDVDSYLLKAQKEGRQVSRQEVLDYLKEHNPRIEVTEKSQIKQDPESKQKIREAEGRANAAYEAAKGLIRQELGVSDSIAQHIIQEHEYFSEASSEGRTREGWQEWLENRQFHIDDLKGTFKDMRSITGNAKITEALAKHDTAAEEAQNISLENESDYVKGPRYESYTLPGGQNYREVLLRMPAKGPARELVADSRSASANEAHDYAEELNDKTLKDIYEVGEHPQGGWGVFKRTDLSYASPHFEEPNIVAHLRLKDRMDADGKKTLFVEEVQSDWDRELREQTKGGTAESRLTQAFGRPNAPEMPFTQGHWLELAMKHVLKDAASKGYDRVAWTTGEQQADRYDLRKWFDKIGLEEQADGSVNLVGQAVGDTHYLRMLERGVDLARLHEYVGKENSEKLLEAYRTPQKYGEGLNRTAINAKAFMAGGEHHLQLYDKMIPQFMEKYGKKWGAKVGKSEIEVGSATNETQYRAAADAGMLPGDKTSVHSMDIPAGMRDVLKQPLRMIGGSQAGVFSPGGAGKKAEGAISRLFGKKAPGQQSTGPKLLERMRETSDAFKAARMLDEGLEERRFQQQGMRQRFMQGLKDLPQVPELQRFMYKAAERGQKFEGPLKKVFDEHIRDWAELAEQRYHQLREAGHDVENYVPRVAIKKNTMWDRVLRGTGQYTMGSALRQTANSLKGRRFFRMEAPGLPVDTTVHIDEGGNLTHWDQGKPFPLGITRSEMEAAGAKFKTALSDDITRHSGQEYLQHLYITTATNAMHLDNAWRAHEFLEAYKASPEFKRYATKAMPGDPIPDGWSHTKVPQLQGYAFEKHTSDVLDRYYEQLDPQSGSFFDKFNYGLMSTIYWNPLKHTKNILDHWATHHGLSTFLNPTQYQPMARAFHKAWRAVIDGNNDYLYALDNGMPLRGRMVTGQQMTEAILKEVNPLQGRKNTKTGEWEFSPAAEKIAKAWGYVNPRQLYKSYMNAQRRALFGLDDILRLQATYHHQALTGDSFHASWKEVSKHLPDYTLPTHVGLRVPFTDIDVPSKTLAKGFGSKAVIFGRYHYGRLKSYGYMAQDLLSEDVPAKERWKAVDRLFVPAVSMALYATLGTYIAQQLTGRKDAEMSPSGATAVPWMVLRLLQGKSSIGRTAMSTFTPNPLVDLAGRMGYGELSRPKPFGEQIKEAIGVKGDLTQPSRLKLSGGLLGEIGPIREAEQTRKGIAGQVDWQEMARRALLNVYVPKQGAASGHRGRGLPHLPRMQR